MGIFCWRCGGLLRRGEGAREGEGGRDGGICVTYWVGGLSRLTLCKVVSLGRAHGDSAYKLVRASSWKSSHPGKHMGIPS